MARCSPKSKPRSRKTPPQVPGHPLKSQDRPSGSQDSTSPSQDTSQVPRTALPSPDGRARLQMVDHRQMADISWDTWSPDNRSDTGQGESRNAGAIRGRAVWGHRSYLGTSGVTGFRRCPRLDGPGTDIHHRIGSVPRRRDSRGIECPRMCNESWDECCPGDSRLSQDLKSRDSRLSPGHSLSPGHQTVWGWGVPFPDGGSACGAAPR